MKTKTLWKSIASVVLLLAMLMLVTVSCKKNEDVTPPDPIIPPTPLPADLFGSKPNLFSYDEVVQGKKFGGSYMYTLGKSLIGEDPANPIADMIKAALDISNFIKEKRKETAIENAYKGMVNQLNAIEADIAALAKELSISENAIIAEMEALSSQQYCVNVTAGFDSAASTGLRFYSKNGAMIENNAPGALTISYLQGQLQTEFMTNPTITNITANIIGIHNAIVPASGRFADSDLKTFCDKIILNTGNSQTQNPANAMACYRLLENYFLMITQYQFEALIIRGNYLVEQDSVNGKIAFNQYVTGEFQPYLQSELKVFLTAVDYLSINIVDYRSVSSFYSDMSNYYGCGIKNDNICGNFIARANMVNSLMMAGLALPTSNIYITMALPVKYCSTPLGWTFNGTACTTAIDNNGSLLSQYPYTYWSGSDAGADNTMSFYRGESTISDKEATGANMSLTGVVWRHYATLSGSAVLLYYNPSDITAKPQSTWSSEFSLAFGSVSLCWPWGYLYLNDNTNNVAKNCPVYAVNSWAENQAMPYCAKDGSGQSLDEEKSYESYFTWGDNFIKYNGPVMQTSQFYALHVREIDVNLGANPNTGGISVYTRYETDPPSLTDADIQFFGGTQITLQSGWAYLTTGDLFSTTSFAPETSYSSATAKSGANKFNFGITLMNNNSSGSNHEWSLDFYCQPIYNGAYNIWN